MARQEKAAVLLICLLLAQLVHSSADHQSFRAFISGVDAAHLGTPSRTVKIVLIRHGQSEANKREQDLEATGKSPREVRDLMLQETDSTNLVDAMLTPKGVEQAKETGTRLATTHPHIKYMFTSPFRRAVDTAVNFWAGYKPGTIPNLRLMPWAMEDLGTVGEIAVYSYDHLAKYPFVDRSRLAANPTFWFLEFMRENPRTHIRQRLLDASNKQHPLEEIAKIMLEVPERVETPSQVEIRIENCQKELRDFIRRKEQAGVTIRDGEIVLVAHGWFLTQFTGLQEILHDDTFGKIAAEWPNAEPRSFNLVI